jgi:hypothetical protein
MANRDTVRSQDVRVRRKSYESNRAPLAVKGLDQRNQKARWVNDIDDRIAEKLEQGYQFINKDGSLLVGQDSAGTSSSTDSRVKKPVGRGVVAYLMAIPLDFYNEDQRAKQRENDEIINALKRPGKGSVSGEVDYGNVSVESQMGREKLNSTKI